MNRYNNLKSSIKPLEGGQFTKGTLITFIAGILNLFERIGSSIIIARVLGPEGKGIYALAVLLPFLIVTFGNLGIGPATVYYVARGDFRRRVILGNNVLLSLVIGSAGMFLGLIIILLLRQNVFPGVAQQYLFLTLTFVPAEVFFSYTSYMLLGTQRIKEFNYVQIVRSTLFLGLITIALLGLKAGVTGALVAGVLSWLTVNAFVFHWAKEIAGGIDLTPNTSYIRQAATYGLQAHLANILGFFNFRIDMFLVNGFLRPAAVGLYSVGVGLAEKLWMVSQAASTVLFPRVAGETEEERRKKFTPLVARTVLWITALGALVLALLSKWIVLLLYSEAFLPAVGALQALLIGIVVLSAGRVLSNDISGRGHPGLHIYIGIAGATTNVVLNILWIPKYEIVGAAWASTVSYTVASLCALFFYCRLSGNSWTKVVFPQRGDWKLYWRTAVVLGRWVHDELGRVLKGSSP